MAPSQQRQLNTPVFEKGTGADVEGVEPLAKHREGRADFGAATSIEDLDLQPHCAGSRVGLSHLVPGQWKGRIDEHGDPSGRGHQFAQQFQPFCRQFAPEKIDPVRLPPCRPALRPKSMHLHDARP